MLRPCLAARPAAGLLARADSAKIQVKIQVRELELKFGHRLFGQENKLAGPGPYRYPMPPTGPLAFQLTFDRTSAPLLHLPCTQTALPDQASFD